MAVLPFQPAPQIVEAPRQCQVGEGGGVVQAPGLPFQERQVMAEAADRVDLAVPAVASADDSPLPASPPIDTAHDFQEFFRTTLASAIVRAVMYRFDPNNEEYGQ